MANDVRYGLAASVFSRGRRPGAERRRGSSSSGPSGSTSTCSRSPRRCRTAASRSPATARTCRSTRWRSTRASSTSRSSSRDGARRGGSRWTDVRPAPADVRLIGVIKRFDDVVAVDDLSLEIPRGSFFALLGPSGCGKTTTLRMIGGFEEPTAGTIELGGKPTSTGVPPYKRDVNTVFQSYALFPHLIDLRERRVRPAAQEGVRRPQLQGRVREILRARRARGVRAAQAAPALGRPAAARRARPRARQQPAGAAARRAARRARPQAPQADAARAEADPARARASRSSTSRTTRRRR